jgi:hypothetical protein
VDVPIDLLHVAAAAVWFGGLAALVFAVPKGTGVIATSAARRFSTAALVSVIVVALTGGGRALAELSKVSQLWTTGYGRALVVKTVLLGVLVLLGWFSRSALRIGFERCDCRSDRARACAGITLAVASDRAASGRNAARALAAPRSPPPERPPSLPAAQDGTRRPAGRRQRPRERDSTARRCADERRRRSHRRPEDSSCGTGRHSPRRQRELAERHTRKTTLRSVCVTWQRHAAREGRPKVVKSPAASFVERLSSGKVTIDEVARGAAEQAPVLDPAARSP